MLECKTYKGDIFLVDDQDKEFIESCNWHCTERGYIYTNQGNHKIRLHRAIMQAKPGQIIDHIDGNRKNNQRSNLRFCTPQQNCFHRKPCKNYSKYKGIFKPKLRNKWVSEIIVNGKKQLIGSFDTEEDAARAYDVAAKKYHKEFAWLNFKLEESED